MYHGISSQVTLSIRVNPINYECISCGLPCQNGTLTLAILYAIKLQRLRRILGQSDLCRNLQRKITILRDITSTINYEFISIARHKNTFVLSLDVYYGLILRNPIISWWSIRHCYRRTCLDQPIQPIFVCCIYHEVFHCV